MTALCDEVGIFYKGAAYWESLIQRGTEQGYLNPVAIKALDAAVKYCNGVYSQLSKYQLSEIFKLEKMLNENGIR